MTNTFCPHTGGLFKPPALPVVMTTTKENAMSDETLRDLQKSKSLVLEIIERLTKVETHLESKADKADLQELESNLLKWIIGTILACFVVLGAFLKYF